MDENLQILIVYKTEQSEYKEQEKRKCMCNITKRVVRWGMGKKLNPKHEPAQKLRNMSWLQALITLKRQRKTTKNWYFFKNLRDPHEMPCQKTVFQLKREQVWLPFWVILEIALKIRKMEGRVWFHQNGGLVKEKKIELYKAKTW